MMESETESTEQELETLTRRRDQVKSRLLADVDSLEARTHALASSVGALGRSTKRLLPVLAIGAAGAAAVGVVIWSLGRRRRHRVALLPWSQLELRVDDSHRPKSSTRKLVENLAGTLLLATARRVAARAVQRWVENQSLPAADSRAAR